MMLPTLTNVPVRNPTKPMVKRIPFLPQTSAALLPLSSSQKAMVWMTVGAIRARVEELAAPTSEMNRSSFGMAAAKPTQLRLRI